MIYEAFLETVTNKLQEALGDAYQFTLRPLPKNNGVTLDGLTIQSPGSPVAPTIYLNPYYEQYQRGTDIHEIVLDILKLYRTTPSPAFLQPDSLENFSELRSRIMFRIIHSASNQVLLNDLPHLPYLDLSIVFFVFLERNEAGQMTALIHNEHMIQDLLDSDDAAPLYVLSNSNGLYGASCMVYQNVLKDFADHLQADLILLPSSVHEVLLTPNLEDSSYEDLSSMVTSINRQEVSPEEQLSNQVYLFSRKDGSLKVVSNAPELVGASALS